MHVYNRCFEDIRRCQERLERHMITLDRQSPDYRNMRTMLENLHEAREAIPVHYRVGRYILDRKRKERENEDSR